MHPLLRPFLSAVALSALTLPVCDSAAFAATTPPDAKFAIGDSQAGNYLSALVAGADRDSGAAELYYRETLRADPRNLELLEHAFASALATGDAQGAFPLAERLIARDPTNSLARLALASRAIVDGQWPVARTQLSAGRCGQGSRRHNQPADRMDLGWRRRPEAGARRYRPHLGSQPAGYSEIITPA